MAAGYRGSAFILLLVGFGVLGCDAPGRPLPSQSDEPSRSSAGPQQAPAIHISDLPAPTAGRHALAEVPARRGGTTVGIFDVEKGDLILLSDCTGGILTLRVAPIATIPITCATDGVTPSQNVIHLQAERQVTIRVDAPETVLWNLRVEQ